MKETLLGWLEKSDSEIQDDVSFSSFIFRFDSKMLYAEKKEKKEKEMKQVGKEIEPHHFFPSTLINILSFVFDTYFER